ncbi:Calcium-activated chloride channel regulator 1 [Camelus dromedarius]|uniref:Calcium-activated chloride channel regulator 1 n=1 Tax=Camelus dromedarius TaxID=9838 RepID=A0A5N4DAC0_CAMDR|nr:Calcium-activated chloride channel regulator 1 [Camelus dromedarius]
MKSSMVTLNNNGYDGIVIAINPSVPEDERLIQNIKADVIVANPNLKYGDDPYTLQYGQCGEKGQYMHFTPNFLLTDNLPVYGPRDVELGQLEITPNPVPLSIKLNSMLESHQSLEGKVTEFCTAKTHNTEAPNLHNKMCNRRSTWDVIMGSSDFQNVSPMTGTNPPSHPTFSLLKSKQRVVCLVLDKSGSMDSAIIQSNQSTSGSEIILLTDGEDDKISLCFERVKQSGAIIHTIALGPSADKELEMLSNMTGGHRFYANKDINGLTNAFSRISSRSGSITQQAIQLESKALNIAGRKWINGTVPVDSTIGNDTFFVVTWTIKKPEILLQDPKGKKYKTSDFKEDKLNIRSARLQIPGADTVKNDGIYSRYFTDYHGNGRYSLKVHAQARNNTARLSLRQGQNKALYIPGYVENGKIILNPPRPEVKDDMAEAEIEDFSRLTSGGSFTVSGAPPPGNHPQVFPPGKITDLEAKFKESHIQLSWTAPGNVLDKGKDKKIKANSYIIRISKNFLDLREDFDNATLVNTSSLIPKEAGSIENFEFKPESLRIENGTKIYIAIQAVHEANLTSEVSNIAQATRFIPLQEASVPALGTKISEISLAIFGLAMILSII